MQNTRKQTRGFPAHGRGTWSVVQQSRIGTLHCFRALFVWFVYFVVAHRSRPAPALLRGPLRRNREGPPRPACASLCSGRQAAARQAGVFNVFLQILDDGRLTDSQGRTVDFRNTIIIMTSNLGSPLILDFMRSARSDAMGTARGPRASSGGPPDAWPELEKQVLAELRAHFRPEFLNRVDDTVLFKPLTLADIKKIVDLQLTLLRARLADRHITLDLTAAAKEHIAREGYDPVYGARPLKRFLQRALETPLSRQLISGEITDHTRVTLDFKKGELVFEKKVGKKRDGACLLP